MNLQNATKALNASLFASGVHPLAYFQVDRVGVYLYDPTQKRMAARVKVRDSNERGNFWRTDIVLIDRYAAKAARKLGLVDDRHFVPG